MANNKTYTVVKDGEELKELKTLAGAKKLADEQGAEVVCEGVTVYTALIADAEQTVADNQTVEAPATSEPAQVEERLEQYTLLSKMNIRLAPSLKAEKVGIAERGKVVEVIGIENDWLHLADGTFILYGGGEFAVRN